MHFGSLRHKNCSATSMTKLALKSYRFSDEAVILDDTLVGRIAEIRVA